jgi:hypothetical protein
MSEECLDECNERTSLTLTISFLDEDAAPVTPDSATYRIDNLLPRPAAILAATAITPLDDSVELEITSDQNQILRDRNPYEVRVVTVEFDYGSDKHGTAEYRYKVLNLYGVVTVASASVSPSASASPSV